MVQRIVCVLALGLFCVASAASLPNLLGDIKMPNITITPEQEQEVAKCMAKRNFTESSLITPDGKIDEEAVEKLLESTFECTSKIPAFKPMALLSNAFKYMKKTGGGKKEDLCGLRENDKNPEVRRILNELNATGIDFKRDFCSLFVVDLIPQLCELEQYCTKNVEDLDVAFAVIYAAHQMIDQQLEPYSCKSEDGEIDLGSIINQKAYTTDFDISKDSFLTKPLPCSAEHPDLRTATSRRSKSTTQRPTTQTFDPIIKRAIAQMLRF